MNDLGDSQIKRRDRDLYDISPDVLYLILESQPDREFVIKQGSI
jgi:hypothetical protein